MICFHGISASLGYYRRDSLSISRYQEIFRKFSMINTNKYFKDSNNYFLKALNQVEITKVQKNKV